MGHIGLVARRVNNRIPNFEVLNLPLILEEICKFSQGMILLAGVTGSGKSTTTASMLDWVNRHYRRHILTLEDPIEFEGRGGGRKAGPEGRGRREASRDRK
jgi:twitching motility protein PilT